MVGSQATSYLVRTRGHAWASRPGGWLTAATAVNVGAVLVLALTGTLMAPLSVAMAGLVFVAVLAAALVADLAKVPAFKALGLHRLWRSTGWRLE